MIHPKIFGFLSFLVLLLPRLVQAQAVFELSLKDAESQALAKSPQLEALGASVDAAHELAGAQYAALYPRLAFNANYTYIANVPTVALPINIPGVGSPSITFGSNNNYSFGPTLNYTIWDTFSTRDAYHGADLMAQAREQDRVGARRQLLLTVRDAYMRLQLALEELRLLGSSLELSQQQNRDIEANFKAGAATQLDRVDSQRDVLSYRLQLSQKQAEVGSDLKDLMTLTRAQAPANSETYERPGPPGVAGVSLTIKLDTLEDSLREALAWKLQAPDENLPSLRGQQLQAESAEHQASSQMDMLYPSLQLSANAVVEYPNQILLQTTEQATVTVALSLPLFEMDRTRHLAGEKRKEAEAARLNREQTQIDADRDYAKAREQLQALKTQRELSTSDVQHSEEAAALYYKSYKGGKNNLIDVQSANNRALTSKVNAARINAQILAQIFTLRSLSSEGNSP